MAAPKGTRPPGGSRKGVPNKVTSDLKAMILGALSDAHKDGGRAYLAQQAKDNPGPFMALVGKVLPTTLTGPNDGPIRVESLTPEQRAAEARAMFDETFGTVIGVSQGTETVQ